VSPLDIGGDTLRAGMVIDPTEYQWSSYAAKVIDTRGPIVDFHSFYISLGDSRQERQKSYAEYVMGTVPEYEIKLIREALQRGQLTGGERFRAETEKKLGIRLSNKKPGRPRKNIINLSP
jgi:putative transposase